MLHPRIRGGQGSAIAVTDEPPEMCQQRCLPGQQPRAWHASRHSQLAQTSTPSSSLSYCNWHARSRHEPEQNVRSRQRDTGLNLRNFRSGLAPDQQPRARLSMPRQLSAFRSTWVVRESSLPVSGRDDAAGKLAVKGIRATFREAPERYQKRRLTAEEAAPGEAKPVGFTL